jgi:hypothetical protein
MIANDNVTEGFLKSLEGVGRIDWWDRHEGGVPKEKCLLSFRNIEYRSQKKWCVHHVSRANEA